MLVQVNDLTQTSSGILVKDVSASFAYSDGEESEQYLIEILNGATDLSSTSVELEEKIKDWPSEYHLSSKRANLLRGLNLSGNQKILELGCGCGAITRYLGEQGHVVDAVEGSRKRAEIAALRCRGLDNVNVVCANFNDLSIPDSAYDAALLIGVVEYAAKFWPQEVSEEEAVIQLLKSIRRGLRKGGVVMIAIENRTGLKYVLGAHEDHYAKRYVGIHGYPDKVGIKTYTQQEWMTLVERSGFSAGKYLLPFPDYKLPAVLLAEDYTLKDPYAYSHLEGLLSRDYVMILETAVHESVFWESANANGTMPKFANSFLILLSDDMSTLQAVAENDFVHFPDFNRKPEYWVMTRKKTGSDTVVRERVCAKDSTDESVVAQQLIDESYHQGNLLSVDWARSLLIDPRTGRFVKYLSEYYAYLQCNVLHIDLIPTNIIVDTEGTYHDFDNEWRVNWKLDENYLLFRALMLFAMRYKPGIREFARVHSLFTIREFIQFCFNELQIGSLGDMRAYIEKEEAFQYLVNRQGRVSSVSEQLDIKIYEPALIGPVYARLYWKRSGQESGPYTESDSVTLEIVPEEEMIKLLFELPLELSNITSLRFDPCDERSMRDIGFLEIPYIHVEADAEGKKIEVLSVTGNEQVASQGVLHGMVFSKAPYGEIFAVIHDNPEIEFKLDTPRPGHNLNNYRVEIHCTHVKSAQYQLVRDRFLVQEEVLKRRLSNLISRNKLLQQEIDLMKASKVWKWGQRCKAVLGRRDG